MSNQLESMPLKQLRAMLKQFKSGYVGMGIKDIFLMHAIEDEILRRENSKC
jgi:hypothetical protein